MFRGESLNKVSVVQVNNGEAIHFYIKAGVCWVTCCGGYSFMLNGEVKNFFSLIYFKAAFSR